MHTAFAETRIYTTTSGVEPVTALLMQSGISEFSVEDRNDLKAIIAAEGRLGWDYIDEALTDALHCGDSLDADEIGVGGNEAVLTFYTQDDDEGRALLAEVKVGLMALKAGEQYGDYGHDADFGRLYAESAPLSDEWKEKWKEGFTSFRATERIIVRPVWETAAVEPCGAPAAASYGASSGESGPVPVGCDIVVTIDPGMAFGTGTHETTAMCLAELERSVRPGMGVLDIGTGSGILAISAALRGADRVTAVECDEDAAASASSNFELNGVTDLVDLIEGDISEIAPSLG
jgi:ribosomal protein L11 methyltransferase